MPYGKNGFNLRSRTCSQACHVRFKNSFGRGRLPRMNRSHCRYCGNGLLDREIRAKYCNPAHKMRFYRQRDTVSAATPTGATP